MRRRSLFTSPAVTPAKPITVPVGTDEKTLKDLRANGYIPIVTDDPCKVQLVQPQVAYYNDVAHSALDALSAGGIHRYETHAHFIAGLNARMRARDTLKISTGGSAKP